MEPHPIPQNVTSFEFHLVGDMTLKQFIYLGAGLGTAYLLYATLFFSIPVLAIPLILISSVLGIAFAFVPIYDRPFDHWVGAFFRAVYSPTKGSFKLRSNPKLKVTPSDPFLQNRLQLYLSSMGMTVNLWDKQIPTAPATSTPTPTPAIPEIKEIKESEKQATLAENILTKTLGNIQAQAQPESTSHLPSQQELTNLVEMARQAQVLQGKISDTEKLIKQMTTTTKQTETTQIQSSLKALLQQTEELYQKTSSMTQATTHTTAAQQLPQTVPITPAPPILTQPAVAPKVTIVQPLAHKETQVVLTSTPNVINGIVGDDAGNFLENVIVIIHDKDGMPVRALKTNKLGQFAGATPLPLGVYTITLEKEHFTFQTLQITLDNSVLGPLRIVAKRGGQ
ncbi:MAG: PrgI family protein [Microgenomates group bacterium]|jgi:hypothetical protein